MASGTALAIGTMSELSAQHDVTRATLPVIVGPTGAGKSAIAMYLAESYGLSIISADSRQIYRGFDIGTAKPSRADRARVPHFGIDIRAPEERYSAHQWASDARMWCREAHERGRPPIVVGGTGFYIRALAQPLDDGPALDVDRRERLSRWMESLDAHTIERWCRRLDPSKAHLGRTQRLRAIETALLTGRALSAWHADARLRADRHSPETTIDSSPASLGVRMRYLCVDPGPHLSERIAARVEQMVAHGWLDEVRALQQRVPPSAPAWNASGYGAMVAAMEGRITQAEAIQRVTIETRQYAKRQRTWNRHQLDQSLVTVLDSSASDAFSAARVWWEDFTRVAA